MQANKHVLYKIYRKKNSKGNLLKPRIFNSSNHKANFFPKKKKEKILEEHKWKSR